MNTLKGKITEIEIEAVVTKKDGTVIPYGVVARLHPVRKFVMLQRLKKLFRG